ncbi:flavin reductase family protein [Rhizobium sp. 2YAF20]|uniref:flavin reductase family protein n=1 Tax=Rhizobium sp. 2YAF20 TaxID=3233027 RepID=UPI003F985A71
MTIDQREFRSALGKFATGVAVVTASVDGVRLGSTISSFNSVSLDPPLVLFSLIRDSLGIEQWRRATAYGISILTEGQVAVSNRFARAGTDKWAGTFDIAGDNGVPLIAGSLAHFQCDPYAIYDGGDHDIFVGKVTDFATPKQNDAALIFFGGRYRHLTPLEGAPPPPADNMWLHGW